jgi:hypothetical protein
MNSEKSDQGWCGKLEAADNERDELLKAAQHAITQLCEAKQLLAEWYYCRYRNHGGRADRVRRTRQHLGINADAKPVDEGALAELTRLSQEIDLYDENPQNNEQKENTMSKNTIKYFYLRTDNANTLRHKALTELEIDSPYAKHRGDPIGIVAYVRTGGTNGNDIRWAFSCTHSTADTFDREKGRLLALERLVVDYFSKTLKPTQTKASDATYAIMRELSVDNSVPSAVKKAAKSWLKRR